MLKKWKRIALFVLIAVNTIVFTGCNVSDQKESPSTSEEIETDAGTESDTQAVVESTQEDDAYDEISFKVSYVGQITGENTINKTLSRFDVGGTDLGIPMYNSKNETMYIFFGDTFREPSNLTGNWRNNVCFLSKDKDLSDGLHLDGAIVDEEGRARTIVPSIKQDYYEKTKIPTGAIEVDGTMYLFYFSKYSWENKEEYSMNYGGCVKSEDDGQTWGRVYDLSWVDHTEDPKVEKYQGLNVADLADLVNKDNNNVSGGGNIDINDHFGYYFTQIFPIDGKDGYIYILGEGGYRQEGIKLGRVLKENIEEFEAYEYFNGLDTSGQPIWLKGSEGCKTVCENEDAFLFQDNCGEHSIMYNEYLQKWVVAYRTTGGLGMRTADTIWGEYGEEMFILHVRDIKTVLPDNQHYMSIYANYMHEQWTEENGKVMYVIMSQYTPFYNSSLLKVEWE